jgi:lysophospholipase L1-like esterase
MNPSLQSHFAHYDERLDRFRRENTRLDGRPRVVLLGDSLTEALDVAGVFPDRQVLNRGINSDHLEWPGGERGVLHRLGEDLLARAPAAIFILIGINDLGDAPADIERPARLYEELLRRLQARYPDAKLFCQSLLPTRACHAHLNGSVAQLNARIGNLAKKFGTGFLDLHRLMADEKGELSAALSRDGLHLRRRAYRIWERELEGTGELGRRRSGLLARVFG